MQVVPTLYCLDLEIAQTVETIAHRFFGVAEPIGCDDEPNRTDDGFEERVELRFGEANEGAARQSGVVTKLPTFIDRPKRALDQEPRRVSAHPSERLFLSGDG